MSKCGTSRDADAATSVSFVAAFGPLVSESTGNALGPFVAAFGSFVSTDEGSGASESERIVGFVIEHAGAGSVSFVSAGRGHFHRNIENLFSRKY